MELNKGIKGNEQKDESPWEYQAKSTVDSDPKTKIDCSVEKEKILNSPAAGNDFGKQSNDKSKKTLRLKKGFLTRFIILSLAIGRCVTAKNIDGLSVKNEIKQGNPPYKYYIEQNSKDQMKIDEATI